MESGSLTLLGPPRPTLARPALEQCVSAFLQGGGVPRLLVVSGDAGLGKSTVLRRAMRHFDGDTPLLQLQGRQFSFWPHGQTLMNELCLTLRVDMPTGMDARTLLERFQTRKLLPPGCCVVLDDLDRAARPHVVLQEALDWVAHGVPRGFRFILVARTELWRILAARAVKKEHAELAAAVLAQGMEQAKVVDKRQVLWVNPFTEDEARQAYQLRQMHAERDPRISACPFPWEQLDETTRHSLARPHVMEAWMTRYPDEPPAIRALSDTLLHGMDHAVYTRPELGEAVSRVVDAMLKGRKTVLDAVDAVQVVKRWTDDLGLAPEMRAQRLDPLELCRLEGVLSPVDAPAPGYTIRPGALRRSLLGRRLSKRHVHSGGVVAWLEPPGEDDQLGCAAWALERWWADDQPEQCRPALATPLGVEALSMAILLRAMDGEPPDCLANRARQLAAADDPTIKLMVCNTLWNAASHLDEFEKPQAQRALWTVMVELLKPLHAMDPQQEAVARNLAVTLDCLAEVCAHLRMHEEEQRHRRAALAMHQVCARLMPGDVRTQRMLAHCHEGLATMARRKGHLSECRSHLLHALDVLERLNLADIQPVQEEQCAAYRALAEVLHTDGELAEAERYARAAVEIALQVFAHHGEEVETGLAAAEAAEELGAICLEGRKDVDAQHAWETNVRILQHLHDVHPAHRGVRLALVRAQSRLGYLHHQHHHHQEALDNADAALAMGLPLLDEEPAQTEARRVVALVMRQRSASLLALGKRGEARDNLNAALLVIKSGRDLDPANAELAREEDVILSAAADAGLPLQPDKG